MDFELDNRILSKLSFLTFIIILYLCKRMYCSLEIYTKVFMVKREQYLQFSLKQRENGKINRAKCKLIGQYG